MKDKTLKDLHLERADTRINDILKAEAVKWVKDEYSFRKNTTLSEREKYAAREIQKWIKWFFNLTDLNEEKK